MKTFVVTFAAFLCVIVICWALIEMYISVRDNTPRMSVSALNPFNWPFPVFILAAGIAYGLFCAFAHDAFLRWWAQ